MNCNYPTCEAVTDKIFLCGACKSVRYCSKEHQRLDWKHHKIVCNVNTTPNILPCIANKEEQLYASCYCEENVYKLGEVISKICPSKLDNAYAVFITSLSKQVPIWHQQASKSEVKPVVWDYHVILLHNGFIYDLDTTLSYPCLVDEYLSKSTKLLDLPLPDENLHLFRLIKMNSYLKYFSSDRSHMVASKVDVPSWPCIQSMIIDTTMNLPNYWTIKSHDIKSITSISEISACASDLGIVLNRNDLFKYCKNL